MARYIDADKLLEQLQESLESTFPMYTKEQNEWFDKGLKNAIREVEYQPTVEVVEVVRCEKCKHLTIHNSPTLYAYCEKTHYEFKPFETDTRTHFCGYGERMIINE